MSDVTAVLFRVWPAKQGGGVIALFPLIDEGRGLCSSFEHVGQHGGADLIGVIHATRRARPEEYAALKRELERAPYEYKLKVYQRRPPRGAR
jgi:hypothetical protein